MKPYANKIILGNNILDIQSTLTLCEKVCMVKIFTKSREGNPRVGGHFGFMQIKIPKLSI